VEETVEILTDSEVAALLRCGRSTLITLRSDPVDPIPYSRLGRGRNGSLRYRRDAVLRWLERRGGKTETELRDA
jgi:hypothetical protein